MIFEQENLQLQLLDVLSFNETATSSRTRARPFCALSLRIEGDTEIDLKNKTLRLTSRDLAFFPSNLPYIRRAKYDKMIVFHFNIQNCVAYDLEVLHDFEFDTLLPLFENALAEWREKKPGYRYRAGALLYSVFGEIRTHLNDNPKKASPPIAAALEYIAKNYADSSLSVEMLVKMAHMSDTYFRRLFKRELGVSPKQYINDLRLEHAQSLLNAGYDTVATVAEKVGFRDPKNFATAFKKAFGYPPSSQTYKP